MTTQRKSLLEQLQESEKKKAQEKKVNETLERLADGLEKLGVKAMEDITPEKIVQVTIAWMRSEIYKEYPASEPKIVEALLLTHQHIYQAMFKEIEEAEANEIQALSDRIGNEAVRFVSAMKKTLKLMS